MSWGSNYRWGGIGVSDIGRQGQWWKDTNWKPKKKAARRGKKQRTRTGQTTPVRRQECHEATTRPVRLICACCGLTK